MGYGCFQKLMASYKNHSAFCIIIPYQNFELRMRNLHLVMSLILTSVKRPPLYKDHLANSVSIIAFDLCIRMETTSLPYQTKFTNFSSRLEMSGLAECLRVLRYREECCLATRWRLSIYPFHSISGSSTTCWRLGSGFRV